ncbi:MAG: sulfatase [Deltaproteobacteria bacterium]|nr:sulfatase [Deltaproteobacteria bacterium]
MLFLAAAAMAAPDIVLVLADDLDLESTRHLSRITEMVARPGVTFENAFVSLSLCCPSRSTILTGLYAHNTGVMSNHPPTGGFVAFQKCESRTIATALDAAGYATGMFGKYLNGYPLQGDRRHVPPGWDTWVVPAGGEPYNEYNYTLNVNGRLEKHGEEPADYLTDVLAGQVESFLRGAGKNPAFAYVSPYAPHSPSTAAPRHAGTVPHLSAPRSPNFDEADTGDKPADIRSRDKMKERELASIDRQYRARVGSMYAVEDLVARVIAVQQARDRLAETWLIFTSDNGFHLGSHRLGKGKETPYEEDLRVPLLVRGPGVRPGTVVSALVLNTDLAPTLAAMAGIPPMGDLDGRSWLGWLSGSAPAAWRDAFLIERARQPDQEPEARPRKPAKPAYSGIRTLTHKFVDYDTGEHELYDLVADPYELQNLAGTGRAEEAALAARLAKLRACKGQGCVAAENPSPPGAAGH